MKKLLGPRRRLKAPDTNVVLPKGP